MAEWDTSGLSGYYTIRLYVVDGTGNSAEDFVVVWLNNVHHFKIEHDKEGLAEIPEQIIISIRNRNDVIITNFTGVVTIDTVNGNVNTISWSNISGQGNFIDQGITSDVVICEFVSADKGIITLTIVDDIGEILDIRVKNPQAEDDDSEGLLKIYPRKIILISPVSNSIISNLMPVFKWEIPDEINNKYLHFKIVISTNEQLTGNVYIFESKTNRAGFIPKLPAKRPGKGNQFYQMLIPLEADRTYYWKIWAWNGVDYYIDSDIWKVDIKK